ncbi:MAG TPA: DNA repair protein RecO [Candidatus Saccharimonadales bacterium]|nr:DNA repair protein RecO [Candidatus Saccharimonadales bacterium]
MRQSISDKALVLARTDYGEKDRIITVLTKNHGKIRAIAKAVRSPKSRLAGGIELFAENELGLAEGRGELYTVTHSRMKRYFGRIASDIDATNMAYEYMKAVNKLTPDHAGEEYYDVLLKLFEALDESRIPISQINIWCGLEVLKNLGASPNLGADINGGAFSESGKYQYDFERHGFYAKPAGPYAAEHLKILRHLAAAAKPVEIKGTDDELNASVAQLVDILVKDHLN